MGMLLLFPAILNLLIINRFLLTPITLYLSIEYTKNFKLLAEAVKLTNRSKMDKNTNLEEDIFEPKEKSDIATQSGYLYRSRPNWLPRVDSNHEP